MMILRPAAWRSLRWSGVANRSLELVLFTYVLFSVSAPKLHSHPLHLTSVSVYLENSATRVTVVVHRAHLGRERPETAIPRRLRLRLDDEPFRPSNASAVLNEDGDTITWQATEARIASAVSIDSPLFPDSVEDSTVVVVYRNGRAVDRAVLDRDSPNVILAESAFAFSWRFIALGIHHILSGPDHVLFVLGLLLVRGTLRGLIGVVTAFTVAHSITLTITALQIGSLPARLVEPLIALSIVAVGAENLVSRKLNLERRMWLAFGFGFFHGFGFAGALAETGLPRDSIAWSLAAFNSGVEIGQACIVIVAVPILRLMERQSAVLTSTVTRYASVGIASAGVLWFVERLRM